MSGLSEVTVLFGQRAGDIEKAREIFTSEVRAFVSGILAAARRVRSEPWTASRVRIDLPREIDTESKATGYLSSQFALARTDLRFKKGTKFVVVAELKFGIEFDATMDAFAWNVSLVPAARYQRLDNAIWQQWKVTKGENAPPGATHQDKANTVRFVLRPLSETTSDVAFNDAKEALEFLLGCETAVAESVGVDLTPGEDVQA